MVKGVVLLGQSPVGEVDLSEDRVRQLAQVSGGWRTMMVTGPRGLPQYPTLA